MANTGFKGVDCRQTGTALLFRALLQTSAGALLTSGSAALYLYEIQSDGTLKSYDFNDNTFKTTALTAETLALTHRTGNNSNTNTGIWTAALATLTGFTVGAVYLARVNASGAGPADQYREFQYGSAEGDLITTAGATGIAYLQDDLREWIGVAPLALSSQLVQATASIAGVVSANLTQVNGHAVTDTANGVLDVNAKNVGGTAQTGLDLGGTWTAVRAVHLDADVSSRMATYAQPTGFLAATFPSGTVANTTNITAGVITTVTNLTNAPTAGDFTAAMKTSLNAATPAVTVSDKTGFSLTVAYDAAKTAAQAGDAMSLTVGTGNALVSAISAQVTTDHGSGSYVRNTEPDNTSIAAIKAKTDSLTFTVAAVLDCNVRYVNSVQVKGTGVVGDTWGPV